MRPRKPKTLDAPGLLDYAVRILSGRALSQGELQARLRARAERSADVEAVLGKLQQAGYLNDQRLAESFARLRLENEGHGRTRVLRDLRARRVAPAVAEMAVKEAYSEVDEAAQIEGFLRRKLRRGGAKLDGKDPRKLASLYRQLLRAGFSSGKIWEALRKLPVPEEWADSLESTAEEEVSD